MFILLTILYTSPSSKVGVLKHEIRVDSLGRGTSHSPDSALGIQRQIIVRRNALMSVGGDYDK